MKGRKFLETATHLEPLASEASLRTQTSRLYYAAFLEARAWCEQFMDYQRIKSGAEHSKVALLLKPVDPDLTASLSFLRGLRNDADYEMELSVGTLTRQRHDAFMRAVSIIARLDALAREWAPELKGSTEQDDPELPPKPE